MPVVASDAGHLELRGQVVLLEIPLHGEMCAVHLLHHLHHAQGGLLQLGISHEIQLAGVGGGARVAVLAGKSESHLEAVHHLHQFIMGDILGQYFEVVLMLSVYDGGRGGAEGIGAGDQ